MVESKSHARRIKGALLFIGILVLGSIVALFVMHQQKVSSVQPGGAEIMNKKATISLEGIHHTAINGGIKDWSLDAEYADYRIEDRETIFRTIQVTFHNKMGGPALLTAPLAIWHRDSNDLDVTGHVMLKNEQYELQTEKLTYIHENRMYVTNTPVTVISEAFKITADNMRYDMDRNIIHLNGNVMGVINEDIGL